MTKINFFISAETFKFATSKFWNQIRLYEYSWSEEPEGES